MAVVMVVDDDPEVRRLIASIATDAGHRAVVAEDASHAWMALDQNPAAFFVDIDMPGESGVELVLRLREHPDFAATPVVFVTAYRERARPLVSTGALHIDIIDKPFRVDEIQQSLDHMLKSHRDEGDPGEGLPSAG